MLLSQSIDHPSSFNQSWSHESDLFQPLPQNSGTLESLVNSLLINSLQFQQETRASIQNLEKQISLLASSMVELVE